MFCTKCGHENPDEAAFCIECGAPLRQPEKAGAAPVPGPVVAPPTQPVPASAEPAPEGRPKSYRKVATILLCCIAAVAVGIAGYLVYQHQQQVAWDKAHVKTPVSFTVEAPGYDAGTDSKIPLHVSGHDFEGNEVDEDVYVSSSDSSLELMRGDYQVTVVASPLCADGTIYAPVDQSVDITVGDDGDVSSSSSQAVSTSAATDAQTSGATTDEASAAADTAAAATTDAATTSATTGISADTSASTGSGSSTTSATITLAPVPAKDVTDDQIAAAAKAAEASGMDQSQVDSLKEGTTTTRDEATQNSKIEDAATTFLETYFTNCGDDGAVYSDWNKRCMALCDSSSTLYKEFANATGNGYIGVASQIISIDKMSVDVNVVTASITWRGTQNLSDWSQQTEVIALAFDGDDEVISMEALFNVDDPFATSWVVGTWKSNSTTYTFYSDGTMETSDGWTRDETTWSYTDADKSGFYFGLVNTSSALVTDSNPTGAHTVNTVACHKVNDDQFQSTNSVYNRVK